MTPVQSMLRAATGLAVSLPEVERAVRLRMEQTGVADTDLYLARMTPEELSALVELVVVPESWFYRDPQAFVAMTGFVRARLAADGTRRVRILSVPCAGGEEPYTMAMALSEAGIAPENFMIDAFDISQACVARARVGVYGRNAFRTRELGFRARHFTGAGGDYYRVNDAIRKQVRFRQQNLLEIDLGARRHSYDVIFCRNLLIYFDKPTTKAAIAQLGGLLTDDGQLFAGYAEVPSFCLHGFAPLPHNQAFGLQKQAAAVPRQPASVRRGGAAAQPAMPPTPPTPPMPPMPPKPSITAPLARGRAPVAPPAPPAPPAADLLEQARRLADLGDIAAAGSLCRDHLAGHPESAEAYFILGLLNELSNNPQMAADYWRRCIYLQPDHYQALCHLALLAEANHDAAGAAALKARAARIYKRQHAS